MNFYALHSPRGFSNEYNVIAFESKHQRDAFCDDHNASAITRDEARHQLAFEFDPGTIDARSGNCYLKTRSRWGDNSIAIEECECWLGSVTELNYKGEVIERGYSAPVGL